MACKAVEEAIIKADTLGIGIPDDLIQRHVDRVESRALQLLTHLNVR